MSKAIDQPRTHVGNFAWEWEDGGGFTAWGTHSPVLAHQWMRWYLEDVSGIMTGELSEYLPTLTDLIHGGKRVWIDTKAHRSDIEDHAWKAHKHWAPWRTKAILYSF